MEFKDMIEAYLEGMPDGWPGKHATEGTEVVRQVIVEEFVRLGSRIERLVSDVPVHDADVSRTYKQIALHALMDAFVVANRAAVEPEPDPQQRAVRSMRLLDEDEVKLYRP